MENATDALIMAGQVLIFIVALTVCMSSFTTVRETINSIVGQKETIKMARGSEGYINYIESKEQKSTRIVGAETVISSMYRSVKENYEIYIKLDLNKTSQSDIEKTGAVFFEAPNTITSSEGKQIINSGDKLIKVTIGRKEDGINERVNEIFLKDFYDIIKTKKFSEYLGEYQNASDASVSSENKV